MTRNTVRSLGIGLIRLSESKPVSKVYVYERPLEYSFCLDCLIGQQSMNVVDIGTGMSAFPALLVNCGFNVTALDKINEYWGKASLLNPHYPIIHDDICNLQHKYPLYDAVTCISVLEHIADSADAISGMVSLLRQGGCLIMTFPFTVYDYIPNVYELSGADAISKNFRYIAQSFNEKNLIEWKNKFNLEEIKRVYIRGWEGRYWRCGQRIPFPYETDCAEQANAILLLLKKK